MGLCCYLLISHLICCAILDQRLDTDAFLRLVPTQAETKTFVILEKDLEELCEALTNTC